MEKTPADKIQPGPLPAEPLTAWRCPNCQTPNAVPTSTLKAVCVKCGHVETRESAGPRMGTK